MFGRSMEINLLFQRVAKGDTKAYEDIFHKYYDRVYEIVFAYTRDADLARDAIQELFLKIWERRTELTGVVHSEAWLFRAIKYQAWHLLRKMYSQHDIRQEIRSRIEEASSTPEDIITAKQRGLIVQNALNVLSDKQLSVYRMAREEGMTYEQIAAELQIGKETVKEHMAKALRKLREELIKHKEWLLPFVFCWLNNF